MPYTRSNRNYAIRVGNAQIRYMADKIYNKYRFKKAHNEYLAYRQSLNVDQKETMVEDGVQSFKKTFIKVDTGNSELKRVIKGNIQYRDSYPSFHSWTSNVEQLVTCCYIGTKSQFTVGTTNATAANRSDVSYVPWFNLNPLQGIAAGNSTSAQQLPATDWIGVKDGMIYFDFLNRSTLTALVKMHFFVCKNDTDDSPLLNYSDGVSAATLYTSNFAYSGVAGATPLTSGNEAVTYTASTSATFDSLEVLPYTNVMNRRAVKAAWKKIKTKTFTLVAGDSEQITVHANLNQFAIRERVSNIVQAFPKGCLAVVLEFQGAAAKMLATTESTIGGGEIGYVITRKLNLCPLRAPNARFETTYCGSIVPSRAAIASVEQISETLAPAPGAPL